MKRKRVIILVASVFTAILAISSFIFIPRSYPGVPAIQLIARGFLNLETGSMIAWYQIDQPLDKDSANTPVIYLHGGPGGNVSTVNFHLLSKLAESGHTIFLYDQAGGGNSSRLKHISDYTVDRHLADLDEITQKMGFEKVILLGQSWGAVLATLYTAAHPEKVSRMILTSPGPIPPVDNRREHLSPPDSVQLRPPAATNAEANRKCYNLRMKTARMMAQRFGIRLVPNEEADRFQTYLGSELNKSVVCDPGNALPAEPGGGFYSQVMSMRSYIRYKDTRAEIRKISCPVLIMKGSCDNQAWGYTAEYLELIKTSNLQIIRDAGHSIAIEQPEAYLGLIQKFLLQE